MDNAYLVLEDGSVFAGESYGKQGKTFGELVFATGMTGYQETLTDPSYAGQIVAMTYTQIGNVGVNPADDESRRPFLSGFVVKSGECIATATKTGLETEMGEAAALVHAASERDTQV